MKFLGIHCFWGDFLAMACFAGGALIAGCPWYLAPFVGVGMWRVIAR